MKKAQIQMGESIAVLIIIILLILFGFIFYARWAESKIHIATGSAREDEAYSIVSIAANLPELHCSENNVVQLNCYDTLKIKHFREMLQDSITGTRSYPLPAQGETSESVNKEAFFFYSTLFRNAKIVVYEVYPKVALDNQEYQTKTYPENEKYSDPFYYVIYNNSPEVITQQIPARIPIRLYDPLADTMRIGVIEVVRYY